MSPTPLIIGIGTRHRGDDAVGLDIIAQLPPDATGTTCRADPSELMDAWQGAANVIVIDAVRSGAPPGTIHQFDVTHTPLPPGTFPTSTHALGLAAAIELARALDQLPARLRIVGVEVTRLDFGDTLSPPVHQAIDNVLALLRTLQ